MKILITGASSYVGARLYYDLENKFEVIGTYFNNKLSKSFLQMNLTDNSAVRDLFKSAKPNMIVHVANFSSPRSALNNEKNFIELNDKTTKYIIQNANIIGSKVVFISSQAANSPDNIYGKLKQKSETEVASCNAGYLILRPSLIVGFSPNTINPRPFNKILTCLDNKDEKAEFDTSWKLQPSYIGHLSQVIDKTIQSMINQTILPEYWIIVSDASTDRTDEIVGNYEKKYPDHAMIPLSLCSPVKLLNCLTSRSFVTVR